MWWEPQLVFAGVTGVSRTSPGGFRHKCLVCMKDAPVSDRKHAQGAVRWDRVRSDGPSDGSVRAGRKLREPPDRVCEGLHGCVGGGGGEPIQVAAAAAPPEGAVPQHLLRDRRALLRAQLLPSQRLCAPRPPLPRMYGRRCRGSLEACARKMEKVAGHVQRGHATQLHSTVSSYGGVRANRRGGGKWWGWIMEGEG